MYINCISCWKQFWVSPSRYGKRKYCSKRCCYKNLAWIRSWRLTATWEEKRMNNTIYVKCVCDCGNEIRTQRRHILHKNTLSCWCYASEIKRNNWKKNKTHGMTKTRLYKIYSWIKYRCWDIWNAQHKNYQLRWIKNHRKTFQDFYKDMWDSYKVHIEKYWEKNTQIDRIDVNWDYCKENCRWVTHIEQQNNKRNNHPISYWWKKYITIAEACRDLWLPYSRTLSRINKWRDIKDAIEIWLVNNGLKLQWHYFIIKKMRDDNKINILS